MHYTSKHLASAVEQRVDAKGRQSEKRKLRDKKAKETDVDSSRVSFRLFSDSQHYQQTSTALSPMTFPSLTQKQMLWPGASGSGAVPWVGHSSPSPCLCCLSNRCHLHTWSSEVNLFFFFLILQKQIGLIANYIEMDQKDKCSDFLVP